LVWHYENTCTSKHPPEVVWDYLTDYTPGDHNTPVFKAENKGKDWPREVERLPGNKVHLKDTAARFWTDIVVDLSDRPNKIPTEGKANLGTWQGMTTVSRTPEGGTSWHSNIDITPDRFGAKILFAILGGSIRKGFIKHENKHFQEFEAAMAGK